MNCPYDNHFQAYYLQLSRIRKRIAAVWRCLPVIFWRGVMVKPAGSPRSVAVPVTRLSQYALTQVREMAPLSFCFMITSERTSDEANSSGWVFCPSKVNVQAAKSENDPSGAKPKKEVSSCTQTPAQLQVPLCTPNMASQNRKSACQTLS